jgi:tRNA(Ile2)-agmatinylcytidine synthase
LITSKGHQNLLLHVGLDDTDSPAGGCTTHIAALLIEEFLKFNLKFIDYPNLLRLNPNIPYKTRGNGSVCLRLNIEQDLEEKIIDILQTMIERNARFDCEKTNPGIVIHKGEIPKNIKRFCEATTRELIEIEDALKIIDGKSTSAILYKNGRGIIGALAAIGGLQQGDYTFEILAYRKKDKIGSKRLVDQNSVKQMDRKTKGLTFNNYDYEKKRSLITPRGKDPVLFGIRGETAEAVYCASQLVKTSEEIERWVIFRTNQGTDAHLCKQKKVSDLKPYHPAIVLGEVSQEPSVIRGGHVFFKLFDGTGTVDCAAYEPTGRLRTVVRRLVKKDKLRVYGGIKKSKMDKFTLNLEKIEIVELAPETHHVNPSCPVCNGSMESKGRSKGFKCRRCKYYDRFLSKIYIKKERDIEPRIYLPSIRAQRHLTKPIDRYGKEKSTRPFEGLHEPWYHFNK